MYSPEGIKTYFGPKYVLIFFPAVVLVVLGVVVFVPVAVARCATFTYTKAPLRTTKTAAGKKIKKYFGPKYLFTVI